MWHSSKKKLRGKGGGREANSEVSVASCIVYKGIRRDRGTSRNRKKRFGNTTMEKNVKGERFTGREASKQKRKRGERGKRGPSLEADVFIHPHGCQVKKNKILEAGQGEWLKEGKTNEANGCVQDGKLPTQKEGKGEREVSETRSAFE